MTAPRESRPPPRASVLVAANWRDHALLDSGDGWKLERVGPFTFARPDAQALWRPRRPVASWTEDARFSPAADEDDERGRWRFARTPPEFWPIRYGGLTFNARCTPFRHLGFFPEQSVHWTWMQERLRAGAEPGAPAPRVLNLFGYTGVASLAAAAAGAQVTHVDASRKAIAYARANQALSDLGGAPIRWIVDDAFAFVKREARRGVRYDGIILDPPKHGRGPDGEVWQLERDFPALLEALPAILAPPGPRPCFVIATLYALRLSHLALERALAQALEPLGGALESGDMALAEEETGRLLPTALFARWLRETS
jgi:23S rRNA (cytosine1962-C5)-methyltransferase